MTTLSPTEFTTLAKTWLTIFTIDTKVQLKITPLKETIMPDCLSVKNDPVTAEKVATNSALVAKCFFPHHTPEIQEAIARFTCAFFFLDDGGSDILNEVRSFRKNLIAGKAQKNAVLALYQRSLLAMDEHYGSFAVDMLVGSVIKSITASIIEREDISYAADQMSPGFPRYFRWMTGFAEAYVWLIPFEKAFEGSVFAAESSLLGILPDLADLTCAINDVLSFHKESVVGDEYEGYVYQEARVKGISVGRVLELLTDTVQGKFKGVLKAMDGNAKLRLLVESWVKGQVLFYFKCRRYRLDELDLVDD